MTSQPKTSQLSHYCSDINLDSAAHIFVIQNKCSSICWCDGSICNPQQSQEWEKVVMIIHQYYIQFMVHHKMHIYINSVYFWSVAVLFIFYEYTCIQRLTNYLIKEWLTASLYNEEDEHLQMFIICFIQTPQQAHSLNAWINSNLYYHNAKNYNSFVYRSITINGKV